MTEVWTTQRVLDLAPDPQSIKAGQGLAKTSKWATLGRSEGVIWGECKGSGKKPYQTRIDLGEPAFKCSCPSRKFPCKHSLGLFLIFAAQPDAVEDGDPPDWVSEWLTGRTERSAKRAERAEAKQAKPVDPEAQAKRIAKREAKVQAGVEALSGWLTDLLRQGLAWAQTQPHSFWEDTAARMIDAQAPGLARLVRQLGDTAASGDGWQERFLTEVGRLHLAVEGYKRQESLPDAMREELRALVGWTVAKDQVLGSESHGGRWDVLGQRIEEDDRLRTQRTWLRRRDNGQVAMILDFAVGNQPLDVGLGAGTSIEAEVVYYPGALPLRAMVKSKSGSLESIKQLVGEDIDKSLAGYADALAINPCLERWPFTLAGVIPRPVQVGAAAAARWVVVDGSGRQLVIDPSFDGGWQLLSISGGKPLTVFGEWNGVALVLLGAAGEGSYFTIGRAQERAGVVRVG